MKRHILTLLFILGITGCFPAFSLETIPDDALFLHAGSPLILSGNTVKTLDSTDPNVVPIIHKKRTLVPLRAISEHFGAEVSYDFQQKAANIIYQGARYAFPVSKDYYVLTPAGKSAQKISYDSETMVFENRTMVPFRVICEEIFSKTANYKDGLILVGLKNDEIDDALIEDVKAKIGQALKLSSMDHLDELAANMHNPDPHPSKGMETIMPPLLPENNASSRDEAQDNYSVTNEQVAGVNEADIVKTDGKFIYVANGSSVKIYRADQGKTKLVETINAINNAQKSQSLSLNQLYIDNGKLVILGSRSDYNYPIRPVPETVDNMNRGLMPPIIPGKEYTYCGIYQINSDGRAKLTREFEIEGSILSSRKKDNIVYIVANKNLNYYQPDAKSIIPNFRDTAVGKGYRALAIDKIMYYPDRLLPNCLSMIAIDMVQAKKPASIEALMGSGTMMYMSNNALYIAGQDYRTVWGAITNISKFSINGTQFGFAGGGTVEGTMLNQFSMDEHKGNLRLATTNWQGAAKNSVYVLDPNLNEMGRVENIAIGERIYSTRFMGDKGYIVTFRQVDPLFVLDLSNPKSPKITGELKVPGFSNYLHPISENVLLGIGQHVDEKTSAQGGIKLSTFDISNMGKPREIQSIILGNSGSHGEVLYNHKALMLNLKDNMIAFDASLSEIKEPYQMSYWSGAVLMDVSKNGNIKVLKQISSEGHYGNVRRLLYIDKVLYYIIDDKIMAFELENFTKLE